MSAVPQIVESPDDDFAAYWKSRCLKAEDRVLALRKQLARQGYVRDRSDRLDGVEAALADERQRSESRKATLLAIARGFDDPQLLAEICLAVYPG